MHPFPNMQAGGGRFDPRQLGANLRAWWDPTDTSTYTLSGSNIATFTDKKGGIVLAPTNGNVTLTTIGSVQALNFGGAAALGLASLPAQLPNGSEAPDVFWMGTDNGTGTGFAPMVICWSGHGFGYYGTSQGANGIQSTMGGTFRTHATGGAGTGVISFHEDLADGLSQIYDDGTARSLLASRAWAPTGDPAVYMGKRPTGEFINAKIGDVIVATGLTTLQRQQVEGYLAWKWAQQGALPGAHPYKNDKP